MVTIITEIIDDPDMACSFRDRDRNRVFEYFYASILSIESIEIFNGFSERKSKI